MIMKVVVAEKVLLARDVVGLTLAGADEGALPGWTPGAHIDVHLPGGLIRQFSLCGDPADRGAWRVAVLREPGGRGGSAWVHDKLARGDELQVSAPRNHFPLVEADEYVFIAGGIGITPILPMLAAVRAPWRLTYGGRTRASMAFLGELSRYGDQVTVRPQDKYGLLDLDALLDTGTVGPSTVGPSTVGPSTVGPSTVGPSAVTPGRAVYCCGPEPLLRAVEQRCPPGALHVERFQLAATAQSAGSDTPFQVELASSGHVIDVPAGTSILAAVRAAGLEVLSSCEEGTCGTCETGVLGGIPDHHDSILTPAEQATTTDFMMICVSRAKTPRLVLDL
jgi:ferredoxin-NADP reductase